MCLSLVVQDPTLRLWNVGVSDDGLLNTLSGAKTAQRNNPVYRVPGSGGFGVGGFGQGGFGAGSGPDVFFQLSADTSGLLLTTKLTPGAQIVPVLSSLIRSLHGFKYKLQVSATGLLSTTYAPNDVFFDTVPMPPDVTMSLYGTGDLLICALCNNAVTDARADLGLWCCACQAFVLPEDTNLLVLLDE